MSVREAVPADLPALWRLGLEAHAASDCAHIPVDEPSAKRLVAMLVASRQHLVLVTDAPDGEGIDGMLLGITETLWFSRARYATDLMVYARRPGMGVRLVERFRAWARGRGVAQIIMGVSTTGPGAARAGAIYRYCGLEEAGGVFVDYPSRQRGEEDAA